MGFAEMFKNAEETLTICQWNGNSDVRVVTNLTCNELQTVSKCKQCYHVTILQPVIIQKYNTGMGGI